MFEPYEILGVPRDIPDAELKRVYRQRAKQLHPDLHPGDPTVAEKFKEVAAAYSLLGDPVMRSRYDRGEIDGWGNHLEPEDSAAEAQPKQKARAQPEPEPSAGSGVKFGRSQEAVISDLLAKMRERRQSGTGSGSQTRGADRSYSLTITFLESINGTVKALTRDGGGTIEVQVPAGTMAGEIIRISGKGDRGIGTVVAGDALVQIIVEPHPVFSRRGDDVLVDLPITLYEAVLGARVVAPTIDGPVSLTIPTWSNGGMILRLKGKGVPDDVLKTRGDQLVTLRVMLPEEREPALEAVARELAEGHPYEVRRGRAYS